MCDAKVDPLSYTTGKSESKGLLNFPIYPFKPNVLSYPYQKDKPSSNFRGVSGIFCFY